MQVSPGAITMAPVTFFLWIITDRRLRRRYTHL